jgi:hypothetical protein
MPQAKCSRCQQWIFSNETIAVEHGQVFHADCRRPQALTYEERVLLYRYCWKHCVAECPDCARRLRQEELASDFLRHKTHLCPHCQTDLTESIRTHLYACGELPDQILKRAIAARDAATRLVKESVELSAHNDVLMREVEAALAALRETMRRSA